MHNKLLVIKQGKNVLVYNVVYDFYSLNEYFKYVDLLYGYSEKVKLNTTLINGIPISMNEYDDMKEKCSIKEGYTLIEELENINDNEKLATIEIEVEYYSKISQILKAAFLDNEPLLNATYLIKMMNEIYKEPNKFEYDPIIDLKEKGKSWYDPRNWKLDGRDTKKYGRVIRDDLNSRNVEFNKKERENIFETIVNITDGLKKYLSIEQVSIFPISQDMSEFMELLTAFAVRNEDAEKFFGSLEDVNINFVGSEIINARKDEICKTYNLKQSELGSAKIKNRMDVFEKFLQF